MVIQPNWRYYDGLIIQDTPWYDIVFLVTVPDDSDFAEAAKMDNYIKGNKEAWEEAFDMRQASWGADVAERIKNEDYAFFNQDTIRTLRKYHLKGKMIGQFCCNNGRELLSLAKATNAKAGIGFDIAENMVHFANKKAEELNLPCSFVAVNVLEIDDHYNGLFDAVLITIGALCWFRDLRELFAVISKCMKKGGVIIINEQHPALNMLAEEGDEGYDETHPMNFIFSYFDHVWTNNSGMSYITGKSYASKTFTDYTHTVSDIVGAMCG